MRDITIGHHTIGPDHPPFVIAEMSGNHNQSLERALAIIDAIATTGAHAVKLQTYTADTMTLDIREREFIIDDPKSLWHGRSLYDLYEEAHTPWDWHPALFDHARQHGLVCFSTPFDDTAVDFLETLDSPAYKIASFENTDIPLIRKVARTGKPIILSTGMATLADIDRAVTTIRNEGNDQIVLLKCTSTYPADPSDSNLRTIPHLRDAFDVHVGLSDHTLGIGVPIAATALGAVVIEKHFTLDRSEGGVDAAFSLDPNEMWALVDETARAFSSLGLVRYGGSAREEGSKQFRRSLYVTESLRAGEELTTSNVRAIRPGFGVQPASLEAFIGLRVTSDVPLGTPLTWALVRYPGPADKKYVREAGGPVAAQPRKTDCVDE
jgi:pseudaminic acid synthase